MTGRVLHLGNLTVRASTAAAVTTATATATAAVASSRAATATAAAAASRALRFHHFQPSSLLHHRRALHTVPLPATIHDLLASASASASASAAKEVIARGWVRSVRRQKTVAFATVSDGSSVQHLQVVADPALCEQLTNGCAVEVKGVCVCVCVCVCVLCLR